MPVEPSDVSCPDCGRQLQVIYATELRQVVSGYACPGCGFAASQKDGLASVSLTKPREYLLRIEKPLSTDDVRDSAADVREEFRARASESMAEDELWLLIDREENTVIDLLAGDNRIPPTASGEGSGGSVGGDDSRDESAGDDSSGGSAGGNENDDSAEDDDTHDTSEYDTHDEGSDTDANHS